jgi:hypothetical protein
MRGTSPLMVVLDFAKGERLAGVLDLSKAQIVEASRLRMLVSLHNWACVNGIHLKLVNPCNPVGPLSGVMN